MIIKTNLIIYLHQKQYQNDLTIYINITSKMETGHAPEGKENWFVMVNAPANDKQDWEVLKKKCRRVCY
ncbi:MAG: hypothetical protein WKG06_33290 [Segetibacter sp.]